MCIGNVLDKEVIRKISIWNIRFKNFIVKANLGKYINTNINFIKHTLFTVNNNVNIKIDLFVNFL